ncbi:MAG: matrixin family metalloprotease [Patescibacteria group bacterium]|nr:matrixin family metalloprotease [Patescibacteria group bacterium]
MLRIVLCLFFIFLFVGCSYWPYSREIWIDNRVSEDEERFILEAMDEWEEETGKNLFEYRGRIVDRNYRYGFSDFFDTKNVIYVINKPTRINGRLICAYEFGKCLSKTDIFICRKNLVSYYEEESDAQIYLRLKSTTLHELGHFIGLKHSDDINSIMFKYHAIGRSIQPEDVRHFQRVEKKKERMCLFVILSFFSLLGFFLIIVKLIFRHVDFAKFNSSKYHFIISIFGIILFVICSILAILFFPLYLI